ncbi:HD domain-containing protein [Streptomyces sp. NPDC047065]|uniref:HD domain-containing protein n=1 Tax=Streptomyces sp. NPDC047065 TaxID=3154606 RepID=UPI0033C36DB0
MGGVEAGRGKGRSGRSGRRVKAVNLTSWAYDLAEGLLADDLPKRWAHSQQVYKQSLELAPILGEDADLLAAAAIVHDVGYADSAKSTGQHMIDGGRYLQGLGADPRLCTLVALHTSSPWEAKELHLTDALDDFAPVASHLVDAITYCDLRSGPDGQPVEPSDRLNEVLDRYGPDHVVFRAVSAARPELLRMVQRVRERYAAVSVGDAL